MRKMTDVYIPKVYLDTSDYAWLYRHQDSELYNNLLQIKLEKNVEYYYSYVSYFELIQEYSEKYIEDRLERARCLNELCDGKVIRWFGKLVQGQIYSNSGEWFPEDDPILTIADIMKAIIGGAEKELPRQLRRRLKNKRGLRKLVDEIPGFLDVSRLRGEFPLPDEFLNSDVLRKYARGEIGEEDANTILRSAITDPVNFVKVYYGHYKGTNPLTGHAHQATANIATALDDMLTAIRQASSARRETAQQERRLRGMRARSGEALFDKQIKELNDLKIQLLNITDVGKIVKQFNFNERIGSFYPEFLVKVLEAYVCEILTDENRNIQKSDFGDILNALYIPYVDLWRGDRSFCGLLMRSQIDGHEKIVMSLKCLPERILTFGLNRDGGQSV